MRAILRRWRARQLAVVRACDARCRAAADLARTTALALSVGLR
jgi:hypothetical protein